MPGKAVGRAAVDLPWLCPNTDSLVRLAESPASLIASASADPALFVFLVRFALGEAGSPFTQPNDRLLSAVLPEVAAAYLSSTSSGWLNPESITVRTVLSVADYAAHRARELAEITQRVHPEAAETAARLAPLGWYAVLSVDDAAASACIDRPEEQAACWELDHDSIARRLAARWRLPDWLAQLIGNFNQPGETAATLGADPDLFAIVSVAVNEAEQRLANLGLTHRGNIEHCRLHLGIEGPSTSPVQPPRSESAGSSWDANPHRVPLVSNLLRSAAQSRRRNGASLVVRLEERIDELHRSAAVLAEQADRRLSDLKLVALAEFAAGAGHEINNPLTAISGHAQRLLRTEQDDDRADSLRAVVRQTQRISGILRELMQFARPPKTEAEDVLVLNLAGSVYRDLLPLAEEHGVRLELFNGAADATLHADPRQVKTALTALIRNGIEAAGRDGWVRFGCVRQIESLQFVVEDSGAGLSDRDADHAFDPFYSGRSAGRGRGLGLPTAWQLARRNAGELRFEPTAEAITRFVLSFPLAARHSPARDRRSA